jgi:small ligand-binding sensory domain FIST
MASMSARGHELYTKTLRAGSGLGSGAQWADALASALDAALTPLAASPPDLVVVFASAAHESHYAAILAEIGRRTHATDIVGCSASAVIAGQRELEDQPGLALLALQLPDAASLATRYLRPDEADKRLVAHMPGASCNGLIVLADPFTLNVEVLVRGLERDYPGVPILGGLATGDPRVRETCLFYGTDVWTEGAVVVGLGGSVGLRPIVSQGCEPIGLPWTITDAEQNIIRTIGGRPAYHVLVETVQELDPDTRDRAARNLLVGVAMNEYRDEFRRGDFLIRNLIGADQASGAIAVAAEVHVGQTIQFQIRDAHAADEELRAMLNGVSDTSTAAALLFACNGRGVGLFGAPDHDARTVQQLIGAVPLAGLFCNGEIGPVGSRTFLHGFTASLALIIPVT